MLLDVKTMDAIDTQGMYKVYDRWPEIARDAYHTDLEPVNYSGIDHIVFAGMGGSGAIGDLFASILSKNDIHVNVVKGYLLPKTVDANTLVVCTSISGNTVETLTVLESASRLPCKVTAFSSGGIMETICHSNKIVFRKIPMTHSPRASFVAFVYSMLHVLDSVLPIQKSDILESIENLVEQSAKISSANLSQNNMSLNLAEFLEGMPCIYYPHGLYAAAIRFKNSLQENSKMHAFTEDVIEACHNGIVAWEGSVNTCPVLIRGTQDYAKTQERWGIIKQYFDQNNTKYIEVKSVEGNILSKIVCLIYLLDYCSIYRAVITGVDPSPVKSIDFIKDRL